MEPQKKKSSAIARSTSKPRQTRLNFACKKRPSVVLPHAKTEADPTEVSERGNKKNEEICDRKEKCKDVTRPAEAEPWSDESDWDKDSEIPASLRARTPRAPKWADLKLPAKYSMLAEFFEAMEAAVKLLRIRKSLSTFGNIRPQIEAMTNRRFSYSHVAQIKHLIPEGISLEKIMIYDESSLCMKPDLKISLNDVGAEDAQTGTKDAFALRKLFHLRLSEFVKSHPEGDDIAEDPLPEPFNRKAFLQPLTSAKPSSQPQNVLPVTEPVNISSHLPASFKRSFSQKKPPHEATESEISAKPSINYSSGQVSVDASSKCTFTIVKAPEKHEETALETSTFASPKKGLSSKFAADAATPAQKTSIAGFETPVRNLTLPPRTPGRAYTPISDAVETGPKSETRETLVNQKPLQVDRTPVSKEPVHPEKALAFASPKTPAFASPEPADACKSSRRRGKYSSIKRSIMFSEPTKTVSAAQEKSQMPSVSGKRTLEVTEKDNEDSLRSVFCSPAKISKSSTLSHTSSTPLKKTGSLFTGIEEASAQDLCTPRKTSDSEICQDVSVIATPPLATPKKSRSAARTLFSQANASQETIISKEGVAGSDIFDGIKAEKESKELQQTNLCTESSKDDGKMPRFDNDVLGIISPELLQSVQERERKAQEDLKSGVPAAKRRQQMLGYLPKLFNVIRDIYRSSKRSVLTRQELMQKILSFHTDVVDRAEVEEQFQLLEEIVPNWISPRKASTGDILYSVRSNVDFKEIHAQLAAAV